jgi:NAD-dependent DNA ligase
LVAQKATKKALLTPTLIFSCSTYLRLSSEKIAVSTDCGRMRACVQEWLERIIHFFSKQLQRAQNGETMKLQK